ncbi:conserved hypothetical protein [Xanthomonas campestris pv. campestris str. 8004]|uniref:Uncharacterized protein n=1 Tax=Xanthomonas campestris pv. campestris (strain 8004) TaxID=314565 RepID=A0A0H2X922_XANC8|nr:conserved hypothetical protein [Xanthomonas campestris pv. campestris str. 8004]
MIRQHHASSQGFQAAAEFLRATRQSAIASSLRTRVLVMPVLFLTASGSCHPVRDRAPLFLGAYPCPSKPLSANWL